MAQCSGFHKNVNDLGIGKCSVPMWSMGGPAGFCDEPAYGDRGNPKIITRWDGHTYASDGKYAGYVPYLACPRHGGPTSRVFKDGSAWCAVMPNFINLQESPAGFGDTPEMAREELAWSVKNPNYVPASTGTAPKQSAT